MRANEVRAGRVRGCTGTQTRTDRRTDGPVFAQRGQCFVKGKKGSDVKSGPQPCLCSAAAAEKGIVGYDSKEPHRRAVAQCQSDPGLLYPRMCARLKPHTVPKKGHNAWRYANANEHTVPMQGYNAQHYANANPNTVLM